MGIFDYQSGKSQGILIQVLGMNPVYVYIFCTKNFLSFTLF